MGETFDHCGIIMALPFCVLPAAVNRESDTLQLAARFVLD